MILSQIEFAYNRSVHCTIGKSHFEVVYGLQPFGPMDLAPQSIKKQFSNDTEVKVKEIKRRHEDVCSKIEKENAKYVKQANQHRKFVEFQVDDMI